MLDPKETVTHFLSELRRLNLENRPTLSLSSYFYAGYAAHAYLHNPRELTSLFETFYILHRLNDSKKSFGIGKKKVLIQILTNSHKKIENELIGLLDSHIEEDDDDSIEDPKSEASRLYQDIEDLLESHLFETSSLFQLEGFDAAFWGFITAKYPGSCSSLFKKIEDMKALQAYRNVSDAKKLKFFVDLYLDTKTSPRVYLPKPKHTTLAIFGSPSESSDSDRSSVISDETIEMIMDDPEKDLESLENNKPVQCEICFKRFGYQSMEHCMELCGHAFDKSCARDYINRQIEQNRFPVLCPEETCRCEFMYSDLTRILTKEGLKKYYTLKINSYLDENTNIVFQCQEPDCTSKLFQVATKQIIAECPFCWKISCLACKEVPKRDAKREIDHFIKKAEDLGYESCLSCSHWIEEPERCNHMICSCGHKFCYIHGKECENVAEENEDEEDEESEEVEKDEKDEKDEKEETNNRYKHGYHIDDEDYYGDTPTRWGFSVGNYRSYF